MITQRPNVDVEALTPSQRWARLQRGRELVDYYLARVAEPILTMGPAEGLARELVARQPGIDVAIQGAVQSIRETRHRALFEWDEGHTAAAVETMALALWGAVELDRQLTAVIPAAASVWLQVPVKPFRQAVADWFSFVTAPSAPPAPPTSPWIKAAAVVGVGTLIGFAWLFWRDADRRLARRA